MDSYKLALLFIRVFGLIDVVIGGAMALGLIGFLFGHMLAPTLFQLLGLSSSYLASYAVVYLLSGAAVLTFSRPMARAVARACGPNLYLE